jgi:NADH-quinone oxidoreductase subunit N
MLFIPELVLLIGSLVLFGVSLGEGKEKMAHNVALGLSVAVSLLCLATLGQKGSLFFDAYRIDLFSQLFKLAMALGMTRDHIRRPA